MTEVEHAQAMIERCETKMRAASDPQSRRYYELCLAGWVRWLASLSKIPKIHTVI